MTADAPWMRPPEARDAAALAGLLDELGHPATAAEVAERLAELARRDPDGLALVAESEGRTVGFVAAHLTPMLHRPRPVGRVTTLVVAPDHQRRGVGRLLLETAVTWCRARGATRIELTTGDARAEAHAFYEHRGWRREGLRYVLERS
jgi:GNAT superfamily N-acetyltransferase